MCQFSLRCCWSCCCVMGRLSPDSDRTGFGRSPCCLSKTGLNHWRANTSVDEKTGQARTFCQTFLLGLGRPGPKGGEVGGPRSKTPASANASVKGQGQGAMVAVRGILGSPAATQSEPDRHFLVGLGRDSLFMYFCAHLCSCAESKSSRVTSLIVSGKDWHSPSSNAPGHRSGVTAIPWRHVGITQKGSVRIGNLLFYRVN